MKYEQILMCVLFVACTALVISGLVAMLSADIQPLQLAHSTVKSLPLASFTSL